MDTFKYTCKYCHNQYIPKRRYSQKYCSNSCRSKAYHRRLVEKKGAAPIETKTITTMPQSIIPKESGAPMKQSVEKMSAAGVGNAAVGTLIADLIKYAFQGEGNQPASKNDIAALLQKLNRYHVITNLPSRPFGKLPYFDLQTNTVVYF